MPAIVSPRQATRPLFTPGYQAECPECPEDSFPFQASWYQAQLDATAHNVVFHDREVPWPRP